MNKLEEIQNRLKEYKHFVNEEDVLIGNVGCNLMFGDIEYLLNEVERYRKALSLISNAEQHHTLASVERIAIEALKEQ